MSKAYFRSVGRWHNQLPEKRASKYPKFRRLLHDQKGVTMLEFAMVAPVMLLLMTGTFELGLAMFAQNVLEGATFTASRLGKTGFNASGETQEQTIRDVLQDRAGEILDMDKINIQWTAYQQFDQIGEPEPFIDNNANGIRDEGENYTDVNGNGVYDTDMGTSGLGKSGEVVVYTISYPWKIVTPFAGDLLGKDGVITLSARTVVQNEPY